MSGHVHHNCSELTTPSISYIEKNIMLLVVMIVISLMSIPAHEASRIFHGEQKMMKQNQLFDSLHDQVPSSTTIKKAFAGHNFSPLRRRLLRAYVPPSAPNPGTLIPASTATNNTAPQPPSPT